MATLTAVPVEEYLRTYYEPDMEYVDGQLVERKAGEYFHSRLQALITFLLMARERERNFRTFSEQRVRIKDLPRYRIPDICVKALPHAITPVLVQPDLVIEVVSPDDTTSEMLAKLADYAAAGIPFAWVVDPYKRSLIASDAGFIRRPEGRILSTPLVGDVDFADLFQQLDEPAE